MYLLIWLYLEGVNNGSRDVSAHISLLAPIIKNDREKMKQIITTLLVLTTGFLFGQSYEGTLVYKTDFQFQLSEKMTKMGITEEALIKKMKQDGTWTDSIKTSYKQGDYISYTNFIPQS